jgi:hypothetical protein
MASEGAGSAACVMRGVGANEIEAVWSAVEPVLARATARTRGRVSTAALREKLREREMQLWIAQPAPAKGSVRSVCLTEIVAYPHQRWCRIVFAAGEDLGLCRAGLALIEAWARARGCAGVEIEGRAGWERVLAGYARDTIILRKEL